MLNSSRLRNASLLGVAVTLGVGAVLWGCGQQNDHLTAPTMSSVSAPAFALRLTDASVITAMRTQNAHTPELMRTPGVVGTAVTADARGNAAIMVLTETALPSGRLPLTLDGLAVVQEVTGKIVAMRGGGGGVSHTALQTPPISLGTSGGSATDLANGFCCSGTLGSLVTKGGTQYILSNSHVFAGDVVSGGNGKVAQIGDDVNQPGYVDNNCSTSGTNLVAHVSSLSTLYPPNSTPNVDCSIAQVVSGMVRTDGAILEIGTISHLTVGPSVGQAVKKSGRTTGLTRSSISGINATVSVGYDTECGGTAFTKTFTGQVLVSNKGSRFLNSGDSGSLMVEDVATNPRSVGLLFAGSSSIAVANPIGDDLAQLGVTMVGQ